MWYQCNYHLVSLSLWGWTCWLAILFEKTSKYSHEGPYNKSSDMWSNLALLDFKTYKSWNNSILLEVKPTFRPRV